MAKKNRRIIISTSTVAFAYNREANNIKVIMMKLDKFIYQIFIIVNEVAQLRNSMRLNDMLYILIIYII